MRYHQYPSMKAGLEKEAAMFRQSAHDTLDMLRREKPKYLARGRDRDWAEHYRTQRRYLFDFLAQSHKAARLARIWDR